MSSRERLANRFANMDNEFANNCENGRITDGGRVWKLW